MSFSIVFLVFITYSNRARNTLKTFEKWGLASILVFVRRGNVPERPFSEAHVEQHTPCTRRLGVSPYPGRFALYGKGKCLKCGHWSLSAYW